MKDTSEALAREILEVVPFVMRLIREEMRRHHSSDLTLPQFRTLVFLQRNPGAALHKVRSNLGLTPPTVSHMINSLFARGLIERPGSVLDRRRIELRLTTRGYSLIDRVRGETVSSIAVRLEKMRADERGNLIAALESLHRTLQGDEIKPVE